MRLLHFIDRIDELIGRFAGFLVIPMILFITYEVILRKIFNSPTIWAHELSQYLFGVFVLLGGAWTLAQRKHVSMDMVYNRLSERKRAILDLITFPIFFFVIFSLLWYGLESTQDALTRWYVSEGALKFPLGFVWAAIPIGSFLMLLQGMAKFVRDISKTTERLKK